MLHVLSSNPSSLDHPNNILVIVQIIKFLTRSFLVASPPARFWGFRRGAVKAFTHLGRRVVTEVSGQPIRPIKGSRLSRNYGNQLPDYDA
jgi:hypothetical protein